MFGALPEFERSLIRERTQAGLAAARRAGPHRRPTAETHRRGHRGRLGDARQSRHRRNSNRATARRLSGDALSLHPRRANREYSGRLTRAALPRSVFVTAIELELRPGSVVLRPGSVVRFDGVRRAECATRKSGGHVPAEIPGEATVPVEALHFCVCSTAGILLSTLCAPVAAQEWTTVNMATGV
jgi:hypothetical protein